MEVGIDGAAGPGVAEPQLAEFAAVARTMASRADLPGTLSAVLTEARRLSLGDAVGVLLSQGREFLPVAASDPNATRADELQVQCGEGPAPDTLTLGRTSSADLRRDLRWRDWTPHALRLGWVSVLSLGLADEEHKPFGVLSVYSRRPGGAAEDAVRVAEVFAAHAAVAITVARERESLARAMEGRNLIGQAQGILMERYGLAAEQAFEVLRRYSSHGNRKLRQVAEDVVEHRRLPENLSTTE